MALCYPRTMSLKEWNVRPSSTDWRVWEVWCGEQIVAQGTMGHAWNVATNAARQAKGRANLFYRLRGGIKDSIDFRQPNKRGRPFKQRPGVCPLSACEDEVS